MLGLLSQILSNKEIEGIQSMSKKDRAHPIKYLLNYSMDTNDLNRACAYYNTEYSFIQVLQNHLDWIRKRKNKLINIDDYATVSGFLGEIRALGSLVGADYSVTTNSETEENRTPEFVIEGENKQQIEVEVHSKQYSSDESKALQEFYKPDRNVQRNSGVRFKEHVITPFGKPKHNENVAENFISKIASIKQDEEQLSEDKTSILWLDFQDELWQLFSLIDYVLPIETSQGMYYSGPLWYAFYGTIELPIFENYIIEPSPEKGFVLMRHDGRFQKDSKVDACIMSFPSETIIFENPNSKNPLPEFFFERMHRLIRFNVASSWINWPEKRLGERIENEIARINALYLRKQTFL